MDQAFLLGALDRVVGRIEVRYQDPRKILQHGLDFAAFSGWRIEIRYLFHGGQNPNITISLLDADARFVDMQKTAPAKTIQQFVVRVFVDLCRSRFEFVGRVSGDVQPE